MTEYDGQRKQFKITIPANDVQEIHRYRKGILKILNKVEIDQSDSALINDLKSVYELLNHLVIDDSLAEA